MSCPFKHLFGTRQVLRWNDLVGEPVLLCCYPFVNLQGTDSITGFCYSNDMKRVALLSMPMSFLVRYTLSEAFTPCI